MVTMTFQCSHGRRTRIVRIVFYRYLESTTETEPIYKSKPLIPLSLRHHHVLLTAGSVSEESRLQESDSRVI